MKKPLTFKPRFNRGFRPTSGQYDGTTRAISSDVTPAARDAIILPVKKKKRERENAVQDTVDTGSALRYSQPTGASLVHARKTRKKGTCNERLIDRSFASFYSNDVQERVQDSLPIIPCHSEKQRFRLLRHTHERTRTGGECSQVFAKNCE